MAILDLFFPKKCLECKKEGKYICDSCIKKVGPGGWTTKTTYSIFRYEGVIRKGVIALKYKYSTEVAKELANLCVRRLKTINLPSKNCHLVPIPLHWHKENLRGFNQSEEVGKKVAIGMGWKFIPDLLIKVKSTKSQVELKGNDRTKNLSGAFSINPKYSLSGLKTIVIFDDVLTTGSTLLEASEVLRESGIKRVFCLTVAK